MISRNKITLLERRIEFMNNHIKQLHTKRGIDRAVKVREKMIHDLEVLETSFRKALYAH